MLSTLSVSRKTFAAASNRVRWTATNMQSSRALSASADHDNAGSIDSSAFSKREYPTRTEAPVITTTTAKDITRERIDKAISAKVYSPIDPFDDRSQFTVEQRELRRLQTKQELDDLRMNTSPISEKVPAFVPPNVPLVQLEVPETLITKLDNGIRVVSQVSVQARHDEHIAVTPTPMSFDHSLTLSCHHHHHHSHGDHHHDHLSRRKRMGK